MTVIEKTAKIKVGKLATLEDYLMLLVQRAGFPRGERWGERRPLNGQSTHQMKSVSWRNKRHASSS